MAPPSVVRLTHVVSPSIWGLILDSPHLRRAIVPEGLAISPYEILDYDATLVLDDEKGNEATFRRIQKIRFLQQGVSAILDHAWGSGIVLTNYRNSAGTLRDLVRDEDRRHLVIELKRPMARGETLKFAVERTAMEAFTGHAGCVETKIDHPISALTRRVVFPKGRPVRHAMLIAHGRLTELPILALAGGRTAVHARIEVPEPNCSYIVRWIW